MTNKFNAKKTGVFDSKIEKFVYGKLLPLQEQGLIRDLRRCNFSFLIIPEIAEHTIVEKQLKTKIKRIEKKVVIERAARYTPDFIYFDCETNEYVALEVKSFITRKQHDYPLRRKLFRWRLRDHNARGRSQWRFDEIEF